MRSIRMPEGTCGGRVPALQTARVSHDARVIRWQDIPLGRRRGLATVAVMITLLVAPCLAYLLTAVHLGSVFPRPNDHPATPGGVDIFVVTYGVHTDLMVPVRNPVMDWSAWFPDRHFPEPRNGEYVVLGWGNRRFFEEVPEWKDLKPGVALRSLLPSATLMHVYRFPRPRETNEVQRIVLDPARYARLCEYLRSGFDLTPPERPRPVPGLGYTRHDAFYPGADPYDAIQTCNEWAAAALRAAGVRMPLWTPFAWQVRAALRVNAESSDRVGIGD